MTTKYQIIYWRDIPAQVKVKSGRERKGRQLSKRFNVAIDEAAMRAGLTESSAYLAEWRMSDWLDREGELLATLELLVAELEAEYPPGRLRGLVQGHGREESPS